MDSETGRVEAFSDGVFAIAITLLILEIKIPKPAAAYEVFWPVRVTHAISKSPTGAARPGIACPRAST